MRGLLLPTLLALLLALPLLWRAGEEAHFPSPDGEGSESVTLQQSARAIEAAPAAGPTPPAEATTFEWRAER